MAKVNGFVVFGGAAIAAIVGCGIVQTVFDIKDTKKCLENREKYTDILEEQLEEAKAKRKEAEVMLMYTKAVFNAQALPKTNGQEVKEETEQDKEAAEEK